MECPCVAVLKTSCGDWHFYDLGAVQVVLTAYAMTGSQNRQGHAEYREASFSCDRRAELLEGITIEQWASYAKRKSGIATRLAQKPAG